MNNNDIKEKLLEEIQNNVEIFRKVNDIQYRIRCPFCGDSQSNPNDTHMYLKCDFNNPTEPILYNCFKGNCGAHGVVDKRFMERLGINSKWIKNLNQSVYNKLPSYKEANIDIITGNPDMNSNQVAYINKRLGNGFEYEDFDRMKIIWDWSNIIPYINNKKILNTLPNNNDSISFLSDDKSIVMSRNFAEDAGWRKIPIINNTGNMTTYVMKTTLNLFTSDIIEVNIAEGIFDILSAYKNFNDNENSVFIAALGSNYIGCVDYAISKGIVGSNVIIKIYLDSDIDYKRIIQGLKRYKYYFNKIYIYRNIKYKDIGVRLSNIELIEEKV